MKNTDFDADKMIQYWLDSSNDDFETMITLYENKRYSWCMFLGHLVIEKLLKALFVKTKDSHLPFTPDLLHLAEKCNLELNENEHLFYVTVSAFNFNTWNDDFKMNFQKICTPELCAIWIENFKNERIKLLKLVG
jgi:hypothetical protein